ncbi:unnamed protein product [Kuraishia capsulata CBS 1993]|uniref:Ribosome biogenesis protein NSA1 n=1 Tax=Kuraishia capsulata CBS 1993 TaxID=1382522 RepID=W6MQG6_9ASCO|nr:uncharacterized protein KUCA_T00000095001 [Kuraishia capsulata CBS 1993]CDK24135.1 unnamed protein product [Kuraishia capsulata CBS 1993]
MRVIAAADDSGSIKEVICSRGTDTSVQKATQPQSVATFAESSRKERILQMCRDDTQIYAMRANGDLCIYAIDTLEEVKRLKGLGKGNSISLFVGLDGYCYTCTDKGEVSVADPENISKEPVRFQIKGDISSFVMNQYREGVFAFGGKETDLQVIKLHEPKEDIFKNLKISVVFKAKNLKNDHLDLRQPVWPTCISFLESPKDIVRVVLTTRYGQVRTYDSEKGRKPVINHKLSEHPLITMNVLNSSEIVCSDTHVTTSKFDFIRGKLLGKYAGAVGSIQSIYNYEDSLLCTGGLDRYVRVFDLDSREQVAKVYVGTQISSVILLEDDEDDDDEPSLDPESKRKLNDDENDELWEQLEKKKSKKSKGKTVV